MGKKRPLEDPTTGDDPMDVVKGETEDYVPLNVYGEHRKAVSSIQFAPSRLTKNRNHAVLAASASADGTVKIWDLQQENASLESNRRAMNPYATCLGHARGINQVSWNPTSPFMATASDDKTCRLWDAVTSEAVVEFQGHNSFVFCVDQHHSMLVTGSFDETVKLWDMRSGDCISTLPAHSDPVTAVSFGRDGTCVSSASHDGLIRIWDVATGECLKTLYAAGNPPVSNLRYAPNSKYLLAGTLDSTLRLWPVRQTGRHLCAKTYQNAEHYVNTKYSVVADFTADGKSIVAGSESGKAIVFDLQSGQVQQILTPTEDAEEDGAILAVSAHDRKPLVALGGMTRDRRVEFWAKPSMFQTEASVETSAVADTPEEN